MNQILEGWQIMKNIANGEIKKDERFESESFQKFVGTFIFDGFDLIHEDTNKKLLEIITDKTFSDFKFKKIKEDKEEFNIQDIEDLENHKITDNTALVLMDMDAKIRELTKGLKYLDKKFNTKYCEFCGEELNESNTALPNMCWECKYGMDE